MTAGAGIIALVILVAVFAVGLSRAQPGITVAFGGLVVVVGAVATFAVDELLGLLTMGVGLVLAAVGVRRDASASRTQQPSSEGSDRHA